MTDARLFLIVLERSILSTSSAADPQDSARKQMNTEQTSCSVDDEETVEWLRIFLLRQAETSFGGRGIFPYDFQNNIL